MTIKDYIEVAHQNAVDKGFWDKPRNDGEIIALLHSELSECLEAMRSKEPDAKERIAEELADFCIRLFDYCGGRDIDLDSELRPHLENDEAPLTFARLSKHAELKIGFGEEKVPFNDGTIIADLHSLVSQYYEDINPMYKKNKGEPRIDLILMGVILYAFSKEIDLEKAIVEKVKRNQSRPRLHNKKF